VASSRNVNLRPLLPPPWRAGIWRYERLRELFDFWAHSMRKIVSLTGLLAASILALTPLMPRAATGEVFDAVRRTAVMSAFEPEWKALQNRPA
jgi:hypothetical protein